MLVVPPQFSGHSATIQHMNESLSLSAQGAGVILLLSPELQVGIVRHILTVALRTNHICSDGESGWFPTHFGIFISRYKADLVS